MSDPVEQPQRSNANKRLVIFLDRLYSANSNSPTVEIIRTAFPVQHANQERGQMIAFGKLGKLFDRAESEAKANYAGMLGTIAPHFAFLQNCVTPSASHIPWNQRKQQTQTQQTQHMVGLRHTAEHLAMMNVGDIVLNDAELQPLRDAVADMKSLLESVELTEYVRVMLLTQLAAITEAIDEYEFWGVRDFETVLANIVGTVLTDPQIKTDLKKPGTIKIGTAFLAVVAALGVIIGTANQCVDFCQKVMPGVMERLGLPESPTTSPAAHTEPHLERV